MIQLNPDSVNLEGKTFWSLNNISFPKLPNNSGTVISGRENFIIGFISKLIFFKTSLKVTGLAETILIGPLSFSLFITWLIDLNASILDIQGN